MSNIEDWRDEMLTDSDYQYAKERIEAGDFEPRIPILQRYCRIGYNKAYRITMLLLEQGVIEETGDEFPAPQYRLKGA